MNTTLTSLDGSKSLQQQTQDLQFAEALRHVLLGIVPDLEKSPWNNATLRPLDATEPSPAPLQLGTGATPAGKKVVWMGVIFVEGRLASCIAYR